MEKLYFPLVYMSFSDENEVEVQMDEKRESLIIKSNEMFELHNENHLFEALELTKTNENDLEQYFSRDIYQYLRSTQFLGRYDL